MGGQRGKPRAGGPAALAVLALFAISQLLRGYVATLGVLKQSNPGLISSMVVGGGAEAYNEKSIS